MGVDVMAPSIVRRGWCRAVSRGGEGPTPQPLCVGLGEPVRLGTLKGVAHSSSQPLCHTSSSSKPAPNSEENRARYPHRRHPEGPALATPLLFHLHLVDTGQRRVTWLTCSSTGRAALEEEAWEGLGAWGRRI